MYVCMRPAVIIHPYLPKSLTVSCPFVSLSLPAHNLSVVCLCSVGMVY